MTLRGAFVVAATIVSVTALPVRSPSQQPAAQPHPGVVLAGAPIHQEADFAAAPARVYQALLDAKAFRSFSGMAATVDPAVGGTFTLFDGHIIGRTLELVPGRRVVQAWRTVDWPEGTYSIVRFELSPHGTGTHLVFDQTGFPEAERASLSAGWRSHYWNGLTAYLK
jgi:activator of HSP90 ATPase